MLVEFIETTLTTCNLWLTRFTSLDLWEKRVCISVFTNTITTTCSNKINRINKLQTHETTLTQKTNNYKRTNTNQLNKHVMHSSNRTNASNSPNTTKPNHLTQPTQHKNSKQVLWEISTVGLVQLHKKLFGKRGQKTVQMYLRVLWLLDFDTLCFAQSIWLSE